MTMPNISFQSRLSGTCIYYMAANTLVEIFHMFQSRLSGTCIYYYSNFYQRRDYERVSIPTKRDLYLLQSGFPSMDIAVVLVSIPTKRDLYLLLVGLGLIMVGVVKFQSRLSGNRDSYEKPMLDEIRAEIECKFQSRLRGNRDSYKRKSLMRGTRCTPGFNPDYAGIGILTYLHKGDLVLVEGRMFQSRLRGNRDSYFTLELSTRGGCRFQSRLRGNRDSYEILM